MLGDSNVTEFSISLREGTTRYISITCKNKSTGDSFNFDGYTVRTHLSFGKNKCYVPTTIIGNIVNYKIPANISVGEISGVAETRIFKNDDVFEVLRINVSIAKATKPDVV